ncbi:MAG TPA: AAA family ATPase [Caulobacteraceae bacterium]|jgi:predicted ATPase|nr:AAA family ATPase [Caulobacteraceae bacterium]
MHRYVLTGAPGAGKTVLIRALERAGYPVVDEAVTGLIALASAQGAGEHWKAPSFIDDIVALQRARQRRADAWPDDVVFFDRSPICTWALSEFLGREPSEALRAEVGRIERDGVYARRVFFVRSLGFVTPTEARRISFEDTLRFEAVHEAVYRRFGYELVDIPAAAIDVRMGAVLDATGVTQSR